MMFGRPPTRLAVLVCLVCLVALSGGAITASVAATDSGSSTDITTIEADTDTNTNTDFGIDSAFAQQEAVEADRIRINIDLNEDGSASWRIEFWSVLEDDDSKQAFESLQDDIDNDPDNYTADFADRIADTVETASQSTEREMQASEFTVETDRQSPSREYGIVAYSFEWAGFGTVDGDTIQAGDAIDGLFVDDDSRLLISWPAEYDLQSVEPEPDDDRANAVLWRGSDTEFLAGEPRLTVSQPLLGVGTGTLAVSLAVVATVFAVAGWLLRRRSTDDAPAAEPEDSTIQAGQASTDTGSSQRGLDGNDAAEQSTAADSPSQTDDDEPASTDQSNDSPSEPDPDLLSNEEQVMRLLETNGGRMKQQTVVQELGWTDAKTSKVVSTLRDEAKLESFRIGRENVLRIPNDDEEGSSL